MLSRICKKKKIASPKQHYLHPYSLAPLDTSFDKDTVHHIL